MERFSVTTISVEETQKAAKHLAAFLRPGDILTLSGDLGAGKTTFTRGLVTALGIPAQAVTSPTFTLLHEYRGGRFPVYHADAYRLTKASDADEIGLMEAIHEANGLVIIEWAENIWEALPGERLELTLTEIENETREISFLGRGERWARIAQDWNSLC